MRVRVHGLAQQEGKRRVWNTLLVLLVGADTDEGLAPGVGRKAAAAAAAAVTQLAGVAGRESWNAGH